MSDQGAVDEPGRETAQGGALADLAEQVAAAGSSALDPLGERTRDDLTLGPGQFDPGKGKQKPKPKPKPAPVKGRRCPPGKHWNAEKKKCVPNVGKQQNAKAPDAPGKKPSNPYEGPPKPKPKPSPGPGGGGTAAPANPNAPLIQAGYSLYFQLWGQVPPQGYIEKLVKQGMNLWEIAFNERTKPAFKKTKTYNDRAAEMVSSLNRLLGYI